MEKNIDKKDVRHIVIGIIAESNNMNITNPKQLITAADEVLSFLASLSNQSLVDVLFDYQKIKQ